MKRISKTFCMIFMLSIFLVSCDGNVFVKPDISKDVEPTMSKLKDHLEVSTGFTIPATDIKVLLKSYFEPEEGEEWVIPEQDLVALLEYLIPESFNIDIDFRYIPKIQKETMDALLILDTPQDIKLVNRILSVPLYDPDKTMEEQSNAYKAVSALYESVIKQMVKGNGSGILEIGNALRIPTDDYHSLTYGDYIAVQMIVSLIFETLPSSVIRNYSEFVATSEETKFDEYVAKLGDNMVKALLVDKSILMHVVGTYTFLNKYNPSTTILDMRNLGSFFTMEEEV